MVTLAQDNFFILTDTFNMCHPSYESMSALWDTNGAIRGSLSYRWKPRQDILYE
jgi:hypothetical protein